jgi:hypothetical protein
MVFTPFGMEMYCSLYDLLHSPSWNGKKASHLTVLGSALKLLLVHIRQGLKPLAQGEIPLKRGLFSRL